jgi:hypothetical protein
MHSAGDGEMGAEHFCDCTGLCGYIAFREGQAARCAASEFDANSPKPHDIRLPLRGNPTNLISRCRIC